MASFTLEWRQRLFGELKPRFAHPMMKATSRTRLAALARDVGPAAWHSEFRVARPGSEVFTCLWRIERWARGTDDLPQADPASLWRQDIRRMTAGHRFQITVDDAARRATAAGVLSRRDAEDLVRFAQRILIRPAV